MNRSPRPILTLPPAFTLVELLVALVLTMILCLVLVSVFGQVAGTYQDIDARTQAFREGRAALQFVAGELKQVVELQVLAGTNSTPPPALEVDVDGASTNGSLGFLTRLPSVAQPTNEAPSDICLVGYFLATPPSGGGQALYRRLIPSKTAFDRLSSGGSSLFDSSDFDPSASEKLAANVVDFRATLKDANLNAVTTPADATYVELFLQIVGDRAAKLYFDPGTPADVRERLKQKDVRDFTLRWKL